MCRCLSVCRSVGQSVCLTSFLYLFLSSFTPCFSLAGIFMNISSPTPSPFFTPCFGAALRFSWLFPPVLSTSKENRKAEVNELVFIKKEWRCNPNDSDLSSSTSQCAVMAGHCVTGKKGEAAAPCVGLSFSDCRSSSNKHICEWEWAAHADIYRIDESKPLIKLGTYIDRRASLLACCACSYVAF